MNSWITPVSIIISFAAVVLSLLSWRESRRMAEANERLYKLAYEQDLLMRKEKHFNELKRYVIEPLLYKNKNEKPNMFYFVDMIRHHYRELGREMRHLANMYQAYGDTEIEIIKLMISIIAEKGRARGLEFRIGEHHFQSPEGQKH